MKHPDFPMLNDSFRLARLEDLHARRVARPVIIDTDTANEIDDQFALTYALLSPGALDLKAIHIAPFVHDHHPDPAEGIIRSTSEAVRVVEAVGGFSKDLVIPGLGRFLKDADGIESTPASKDLIERALAQPGEEPLIVVGIGAATNIANAILLEPGIVERIVVVWLGGHCLSWSDTAEYNLRGDPFAARVLFDCGVPLVHVPCHGLAGNLTVSLPEIDQYVAPHGEIGAFLSEIIHGCFPGEAGNERGRTRALWDVATIAYLVNPGWFIQGIVPAPVITSDLTWGRKWNRHSMRYLHHVWRDEVIRDFFLKLKSAAEL